MYKKFMYLTFVLMTFSSFLQANEKARELIKFINNYHRSKLTPRQKIMALKLCTTGFDINSMKESVLHVALYKGIDDLSFFKELLQAGADPLRLQNGQTALSAVENLIKNYKKTAEDISKQIAETPSQTVLLSTRGLFPDTDASRINLQAVNLKIRNLNAIEQLFAEAVKKLNAAIQVAPATGQENIPVGRERSVAVYEQAKPAGNAA